MQRATVVHSIKPHYPMCNGLTFDGRNIWSNEYGTGSPYNISQLDPVTGAVIRTYPSKGYAGLTWDGSNLWHSYFAEATIYKLNPDDGTVLHSFRGPRLTMPKVGPMGLAWDGRAIWTSDHVSSVFRLNPGAGEVLAQYDVPGTRVHGLTWFRGHLWYVDTDGGMIYEIDPANGKVLTQVQGPEGVELHGLTNDGECLWISDTQKDPARDLIYRVRLP